MKRPASIVLITTSFPTRGDGSEAAGSFVVDLAVELARWAPVRVVAPGPVTSVEAAADGVQVFRFAAPSRPLSTLNPWNPVQLISILRVLHAGMEATRAAAGAGPVLHFLALWALPSGYWARSVARVAGVPYSVWTLGSDIWSLGRIPVLRSYLRAVLGGAARRYADGIELARDTQRICGGKVHFLPSTRRIDGVRNQPPRRSPPYRLVFLGRWHPNKGVDLLLSALELLGDDEWGRIEEVSIFGGGPLQAVVFGAVNRLKEKGRPVMVGGYLNKLEAQDVIRAADYLVIPSRVESIPVVFSDAVKLGCPVLCTPVGDLPELVRRNPECGIVAEDCSASSIAGMISSGLRCSASDFEIGLKLRAELFDLAESARRLASDIGAI